MAMARPYHAGVTQAALVASPTARQVQSHLQAKYQNTYPATVILSLDRFDRRTQEPASFHDRTTVMWIKVSPCPALHNEHYQRNFIKLFRDHGALWLVDKGTFNNFCLLTFPLLSLPSPLSPHFPLFVGPTTPLKGVWGYLLENFRNATSLLLNFSAFYVKKCGSGEELCHDNFTKNSCGWPMYYFITDLHQCPNLRTKARSSMPNS